MVEITGLPRSGKRPRVRGVDPPNVTPSTESSGASPLRGADPADGCTRTSRSGASPRARGRQRHRHRRRFAVGSIPACAGPTRGARSGRSGVRKHPRVRGADSPARWRGTVVAEASPRARGRPQACAGENPPVRSIPACAGPTAGWRGRRIPPGKHPRVRGADELVAPVRAELGEASPRARGRLGGGFQGLRRRRSIPACAGPTSISSRRSSSSRKHPRVRGADLEFGGSAPRAWEASPRARGRPPRLRAREPDDGSIPACAGPTS